jgi:hypothetical protein
MVCAKSDGSLAVALAAVIHSPALPWWMTAASNSMRKQDECRC